MRAANPSHGDTRAHQGASALVRVSGLHVHTLEGRPLFRDLEMALGRDQVAIIGRNGAGKSTLLEILSGRVPARRGEVELWTEPVLVPQDPDRIDVEALAGRLLERAKSDRGFCGALTRERAAAGLRPLDGLMATAHASRGERRKLALLAARLERPALLLLDEPTEDLDERGLAWLEGWLSTWTQGLVTVSHDRRLLGWFRHFFLVAESGCRYLPGRFAEVEAMLERESDARERQYARNLERMAAEEQRNDTILRRRKRKKNVGRLHELRRRTSRARLNQKRGDAQESQARAARIREARVAAVRRWAEATRRALAVRLPLEVHLPELPAHDGRDNIALVGVSTSVRGRVLFRDLDVRIGRGRIAVTGPNGAGKTTLLRVMLGSEAPTTGRARRRLERVGGIAQGATDWMTEESLLGALLEAGETAPDKAAQVLVAHRFPLALAERPMASLSPGERVRAALICLFARSPAPEVLVLDEPTYSLDFVGTAALADVLRGYAGGLVVASHDRDFLAAIGMDEWIALDGGGGYRVARID